MTNKPKAQHGGKRTPGPGKKLGPPKKPYPLHVIKIQCTEEELRQILAQIPDTRRRAEVLLAAGKGEIVVTPAEGEGSE